MIAKFFAIILAVFQSFLSLFIQPYQKSPLFQKEQKNIKNNVMYHLPVADALFAQAQISPILPLRRWDVEEFETNAASALVLDSVSGKILYQKEIGEKLPIASLTKLMTALVVLEKSDLNQTMTVSKKAIETYGEMGALIVNEKITMENLLYALLLESSNDAAVALAENINSDFIDLMNQKAAELNLKDTYFFDVSGLKPENTSTTWDLSQLVKSALTQPILWEIMRTPSIDIFSSDGFYARHLINTNILLNKFSNIVGGKTGYTEEAGECMILVTQEKNHQIIFVILNAQNRFQEMSKLVEWTQKAYIY